MDAHLEGDLAVALQVHELEEKVASLLVNRRSLSTHPKVLGSVLGRQHGENGRNRGGREWSEEGHTVASRSLARDSLLRAPVCPMSTSSNSSLRLSTVALSILATNCARFSRKGLSAGSMHRPGTVQQIFRRCKSRCQNGSFCAGLQRLSCAAVSLRRDGA